MSSLWVKFQPSSTPPSDRFWWGVLVVLVVLVLLVVHLVTGVKQSQLLVLRLSLEFDKRTPVPALRLLSSPTNMLKLFASHYGTPCR